MSSVIQNKESSPIKWEPEDSTPFQSSTHFMMKAPFATDHSIQDVQRVTQQLQTRLMQLSFERNELQSEYVKMPAHAGRTAAARARKKEVETQIDTVTQEMGRIRFKLKCLNANMTV